MLLCRVIASNACSWNRIGVWISFMKLSCMLLIIQSRLSKYSESVAFWILSSLYWFLMYLEMLFKSNFEPYLQSTISCSFPSVFCIICEILVYIGFQLLSSLLIKLLSDASLGSPNYVLYVGQSIPDRNSLSVMVFVLIFWTSLIVLSCSVSMFEMIPNDQFTYVTIF